MKEAPKLIGVIHLRPLPGSIHAHDPAWAVEDAGFAAVQEAKILEKAGFDGVIIENFGDAPFAKDKVASETIAAISMIGAAVRETCKLKIGINLLRNAALDSMSVASVIGADFIRVNVLAGAACTDQGWIEGCAHELLAKRQALGSQVRIFADVKVKHAQTYPDAPMAELVLDLIKRAHADAVIVTGSGTGRPVSIQDLDEASEVCLKLSTPLYVGSGATADSLSDLAGHAYGVIVGSYLRKPPRGGHSCSMGDMDRARVAEFAKEFRKTWQSPRRKKRKT